MSTSLRFVNVPPPKSATNEEVEAIAASLSSNPHLLLKVVQVMSPESRRRLVIQGGAMEWFGKDSVSKEMAEADHDKDYHICPKDFERWFEKALKRRAMAAEASSEFTSSSGAKAAATISVGALVLIGLEAALPFVGFGFLDNATMILAGDVIDKSLGAWLGCSVLASAAMGNVVSGVFGMQFHGFIEKAVHKLHLPIPVLTQEQQRSNKVFFAGHIGGTIGIAVGLSLGMLPLLFVSDSDE